MNTKKDLCKRKYLGLIAAGILAVFLMGCGSAGAGGDGGGGGDLGGGGGGGLTTALVEGTMAVSGDAEGEVSFSFEVPTGSSSYTAKELKSATGILSVSGGIGSFKIGLEGTYDTVTGYYDLTAEGNLLGTFISITVRGQLDANRNFMESHVSVTTLDSEGNLKVSSGTGAQKPGTEGEVKNQVQNSGVSSVTQVSPGDAIEGDLVSTLLKETDYEGNRVARHETSIVFPEKLPPIRVLIDELIKEALRRSEGRQNEAAAMLGITPQALSKRLKQQRSIYP